MSTTRRTPASRRFVTWLLRSPFSGLVDGALMLITVRGRRSGRAYTFPVQYARDGDAIWVLPGHSERKTWWRNLSDEAPVKVRLAGQDITAVGRAFTGRSTPAVVEEGLGVYAGRFRAVGRRLGVLRGHVLDDERLRELAKSTVMVRIVPRPAQEAHDGADGIRGRRPT